MPQSQPCGGCDDARVVAAFPLYDRYQKKTERTIPLFVLEPLVE